MAESSKMPVITGFSGFFAYENSSLENIQTAVELAPWAGFDTKTEGDNQPALNYTEASVFASCNDDTEFTGCIQFHFLYFGSLFDRAEFHFPPK